MSGFAFHSYCNALFSVTLLAWTKQFWADSEKWDEHYVAIMRSSVAYHDGDVEEKNNGEVRHKTEVMTYFDIVSINGLCSKAWETVKKEEKIVEGE